MERIVNFRQLGEGAVNREGKKIKPDTIFRSGLLFLASDKDKNALKEFGIEMIFDLRSKDEALKMPSLDAKVFTTHNVDILSSADPRELLNEDMQPFRHDDMVRLMDRLYAEQFANTDRFGYVLNLLLNNRPDVFLFHCTAGRDRTGVFGAILMMIMDFDRDDIMEEYLRYDKSTAHILANLIADSMKEQGAEIETNEHAMNVFLYPIKSNMEVYLDAVMETHGTFDRYLLETFGMTNAKKKELKDKYMIDA